VTLAVTGNTISGLRFWRQRMPEIKDASTAVHMKSI
jgi:hypothetical protein